MKPRAGPLRVTHRYDGREAMDVLAREPDIGLVLLDLMSAAAQRLDVLAQIRADPRWTPPALHHTSPPRVRSSSTEQAMDSGRRVLTKPFSQKSRYHARPRKLAASRARERRGDRMSRWAVVLAGGVGSRVWPVSTPVRHKQLLPLVTAEPMLAATLRRLRPLATPKHPWS